MQAIPDFCGTNAWALIYVTLKKNKANRQTQAEFKCVLCGHEEHAGVVGAKNVLERGLRLLACGGTVVGLR
ncbi:MAG: transposase [Thiotrichaceae bacterium]|nr:transposase [Thiotrichaceae bacterium]